MGQHWASHADSGCPGGGRGGLEGMRMWASTSTHGGRKQVWNRTQRASEGVLSTGD